MRTRDMTRVALMAALLCVLGPLTVAIGPIPLSLATFAVYLAGAVLGPKRGTLAVALYLLIGSVGVPVFSGFSGGVQKLAGVTGGYLAGYLACAALTGLGVNDARPSAWRLAGMMVVGTVALYAVGTAWFMLQTKNPLGAALGMCVLPFLPGDAVKIAAATAVSPTIRRAVQWTK